MPILTIPSVAWQDAELQRAHSMPEGSFGKAYASFMGVRNFRADDRPPVRFIADPELAYVALRARQVHDFWHVLFDCPTTVLGELAIKAVEFVQAGTPSLPHSLSIQTSLCRLQGRHQQCHLTGI